MKTPKLYLSDPGLAAFLMGIAGVRDLAGSPLVGALWETLVFAEIRRRQLNRHGGWTLHFWRDRTKEADFLHHRGGRFDLADARWAAAPDAHDAARLERIASELPRGRVDRLAILCRCENPYPLSSRVQALPLEEGTAMFARAA